MLAPYWDTPAKWKLNLLILILIRVENLEKKWVEKAALKKILHVRSSVINYKQNSVRIICKKTYKIMFFKLSVSLHSTDANS